MVVKGRHAHGEGSSVVWITAGNVVGALATKEVREGVIPAKREEAERTTRASVGDGTEASGRSAQEERYAKERSAHMEPLDSRYCKG